MFELAKEQQDELAMPDDLEEEEITALPTRTRVRMQESDDEDEDLDYTGVADIEYEEEFVSTFLAPAVLSC